MAFRRCTVAVVGAMLLPSAAGAVLARGPEDDLAKEMTHDLEMNFNKIAPFGKEDTAKELQDHAAKTQDTLVDAVENAEVAEIKRAVFRALTRLRAATIKEFDTGVWVLPPIHWEMLTYWLSLFYVDRAPGKHECQSLSGTEFEAGLGTHAASPRL